MAIVNSATIATDVQVSLLADDLDYFQDIPRSSMAGSYANSICTIFRHLYVDFHSE